MTQPLLQTVDHDTATSKPNEEGPVVLATKPFDSTEAPLAIARWLADREDRELHVVSVLDQQDVLGSAAGTPPLPPRYYEEEREAIAERMRVSLAADVTSGVQYRVDVLDGPSARTVVEVAHDRGARVIVIGTGRHDSLGRFVYGERAMQIVRIADRPVLVVPRDAKAATIRRVLVAVDFSTVSLRAARAVAPMLSEGATMTLVHVKPAIPSPEGRSGTGNATHELRCDDLFRRFIKLLPALPGVRIETKVLWGDSSEAIQRHALESHADLIACGRRHNHSLVERFLIGSVSSALIRTVSCPILIAPEIQDQHAAETHVTLTGVEHWTRDAWRERLDEFSHRNQGRTVRLGIDTEAVHGGRCVAQGYALRAIAYDVGQDHATVLLGDATIANTVMSLKLGNPCGVTLFTDISGRDARLVLETATGRCTVSLSEDQQP